MGWDRYRVLRDSRENDGDREKKCEDCSACLTRTVWLVGRVEAGDAKLEMTQWPVTLDLRRQDRIAGQFIDEQIRGKWDWPASCQLSLTQGRG